MHCAQPLAVFLLGSFRGNMRLSGHGEVRVLVVSWKNAGLGMAQIYTGGADRRFRSMFPLIRATHFGVPVF